MPRNKRSPLWSLSYARLAELKEKATNISHLCELLGINPNNGAIKTLYSVANHLQFDLRFDKRINRRKLSNANVFCENSTASRTVVRKLILKQNLLEYKCAKCSNNGHWQAETLTLQLEHINGVNNDHRLENLCWLCPNCHSQSPTFSGRNSKRIKRIKQVYTEADRMQQIINSRKFHVEKEELAALLSAGVPLTTIAKRFGVSDNAIRKRAKFFGLIPQNNCKSQIV